ncbi:MAG: hypothetical protein WCA46_13850 [Actinocatenispora sp.]
MNIEDLRTSLHETAADIVPPADVVSRARSGGRRRLYRRRGAIVGGVAAVVALAVGGVLTVQHPTTPGPAASTPTTVGDMLGRPARGNLVHDRRAVAAATKAYKKNTHGANGSLAWLSRTRYGDVAVFVRGTTAPRAVSLTTFDRSGSGPFRIAYAHVTGPDQAGLADPVFGERPRAVFVLDFGAPAYYSTRHVFTADGTRRVWHKVRFHDGAATLPVPDGDTMLVAGTRHPKLGDIVSGNPLRSSNVPDRSLGWGPAPAPGGSPETPVAIPATPGASDLPWARHGGAAKVLVGALKSSPYTDPLAYWPAFPSVTPWVVYGQTPAGQRFAVGEVQYDSEPSHIYALVGDTVRYVGVSDRNATLPVRVRLSDGSWVVAAKGRALAYRDRSGWHDAGRDAALLPKGATQVRVGTVTMPLG